MDMRGLWMEMNMKAHMTMAAVRGMADTSITMIVDKVNNV